MTSSVMQFQYQGFASIFWIRLATRISARTLTAPVAADSAVMLLDGAKGVEAQTIKLFHVCRMRQIPIFTFINKLDRAIKDPFT